MNRRRGMRSLCCAAVAVSALSLGGLLQAAEAVKIGFLSPTSFFASDCGL